MTQIKDGQMAGIGLDTIIYWLPEYIKEALRMAANSTFEMTLPKYDNKSIEIWMKVLEWPKGGGVNINVNGVESFYDLFSSGHDFPLIKIFDGKSDSSIISFLEMFMEKTI